MREIRYATTVFSSLGKKTVLWKTADFEMDEEIENSLINIYPDRKYQTIDGFGGAVTESAAYIYSLLDEKQKRELIHQYFGCDEMRYDRVRVSIDSCDFSLEHYEASSTENQEGFSMERVHKYILPMLRDIQEILGEQMKVMMTPWSPPSFMKTTGKRNVGGHLKEEYREQWAEYICRYIEEYRNLGFTVDRISIQNEPKAVQPWDSCIYTAEEEKEFLAEFLFPALQKHGLSDVKIFIWDHNKERAYERAVAVIDEKTDAMIAGVAVHWYSGDHFDALRMIREQFPEKEIIISEACIEYSKFSKDNHLLNAQKYAHDMIGDLNNGLNAFYDWNLLLDEVGGPNHVGNYCDAPYLFDKESKKLMEQNSLFYLWHFSHFISGGSVRIGTTSYTDKIEVTAFEKEGIISVILLNRNKEELPVFLRLGEEVVFLAIPAESIVSGIIV